MAVPDISAEINAFRNAAYGEDVREALIQLAQKLRGVITSELMDMSDTWDSYKDNMDEDWSNLQEYWSAYQTSMNGAWSTYQSTMNNNWTNYQSTVNSALNAVKKSIVPATDLTQITVSNYTQFFTKLEDCEPNKSYYINNGITVDMISDMPVYGSGPYWLYNLPAFNTQNDDTRTQIFTNNYGKVFVRSFTYHHTSSPSWTDLNNPLRYFIKAMNIRYEIDVINGLFILNSYFVPRASSVMYTTEGFYSRFIDEPIQLNFDVNYSATYFIMYLRKTDTFILSRNVNPLYDVNNDAYVLFAFYYSTSVRQYKMIYSCLNDETHILLNRNAFLNSEEGILAQARVIGGKKYIGYILNVYNPRSSSTPSIYFMKSDDTIAKAIDFNTLSTDSSVRYFNDIAPEDASYIRFYGRKGSLTGPFTCQIIVYEGIYTPISVIDERLTLLENKSLVTRQSSLNVRLCNIFRKVVCCGDSYTSGYIKLNGASAADRFNLPYAWPEYMCKITGQEWINCGHSGSTAKTWQTNASGLPLAQTVGRAQAYVVGLAINDTSRLALGTADDIGQHVDSYYSGMSEIVEALHTINPLAKLFINTCPKKSTTYSNYNNAIRTIVAYYKNYDYPIHCIDLDANSDLYSNSSLTSDAINGHYTALGYEQFAEIYAYILSKYIGEHVSEFQDVYQIPYDVTDA